MAPIVVFLGPTLEHRLAAEHLDAVYLPPAEQGSVFGVVENLRPRAVVIIDGAFARVPAVRHKEILWALHRGVPVFGAASMGAVRAAELWAFGMQGYGFIYRWYRATPFADDDEVAVAMTPAELGALPLSEALINMRLTLRRAERAGVMSGLLRRRLEDIARSIHFVGRTVPALLERAEAETAGILEKPVGELQGMIEPYAVDQKKADAIGLLRRLAAAPELTDARARSTTPWRLTEAWAEDLDAAGYDTEHLLADAAIAPQTR